MARSLIKNDHQVIATMRDIDGKNREAASELTKLGANVVELDVTNDASVTAAVEEALSFGNIDVVVNNAGIGVLGVQEAFSADEFQKLFEINVFGVHRVMRAFIPHFRERQQGCFVNVSSLLGRMTIPYYGPYNASKWALEALSENYRTELSQFGIEVCILEPGGFPTTFMDRLIKPKDTSRDKSYEAIEPGPQLFFDNFEQALKANPSQDPQDVADALVSLVSKKRGEKEFRTVVDKMGMGEHIEGYNVNLNAITGGIYGAFHIDHLLTLKDN